MLNRVLACGYVKILQPVAICSYFRNITAEYQHTNRPNFRKTPHYTGG